MAEAFATVFQDEALVVKSILESAGISAEISGEHILDVYPIFFPENRGIRVVVPDSEAEDAAAIVAEYRAAKASRSAGAGEE